MSKTLVSLAIILMAGCSSSLLPKRVELLLKEGKKIKCPSGMVQIVTRKVSPIMTSSGPTFFGHTESAETLMVECIPLKQPEPKKKGDPT